MRGSMVPFWLPFTACALLLSLVATTTVIGASLPVPTSSWGGLPVDHASAFSLLLDDDMSSLDEHEHSALTSAIDTNNSNCKEELLKFFAFEPPYVGDNWLLMILSGGKGLGDLGDYLTCSQVDVARYAWAGPTLNASVGMCVPSPCDSEDISAVLKLLAQGLHIPVLNETNTRVHTVDAPKHPDPGTIALVLLMCALGLTISFCTGADLISRWGSSTGLNDELEFLLDPHDDTDDTVDYGSGGSAARKKRKNRKSSVHWVVQTFSVREHAASLFSRRSRNPHGELSVWNGLRVFSMAWIILGNTYLLANGILKNPVYVEQFVVRRFTFQYVISSALAVETFLLMGGFLSFFWINQSFTKGDRGIAAVYIHRIVRFLPSLIAVLFFWYRLMRYVSNGPLWFMLTNAIQGTCAEHWLSTLLLVNNFTPNRMSESCLSWTWYLAVDFQLFLITPLLVLLYRKNKKACLYLTIFLLVASLTTNGVLAHVYSLSPNMIFGGGYGDFRDILSSKPYTRAQSYLVGVLLYQLLEYLRGPMHLPPSAVNIPRPNQLFILTLSLLAIFFATYGPYRDYSSGKAVWHEASNVLYIVLGRFVFCASVASIALLCMLDRGGVIRTFLCSRAWLPLSKLTFGAFLTNPIVISAVYYSSGDLIYYRDITFVFFFITNFILSYASSLLLYVAVERPFCFLENQLLGKRKGEAVPMKHTT